MKEISGEVGFKKIEALEAQSKWTEAAEAYMAVYKSNPASPLAEKALYNSYISYEKSGDGVKATETSHLFLAMFPKSEYSQKLLLMQAKDAEKLYDFEAAQKLYHEYYKRFPKDKEAAKALYNSAVFAELLAMNAVAVDLYHEYIKSQRPNAEEQKAIQISLAKLYRRLGQWDKMTAAYRKLAHDAQSVDEKMNFLGELTRHLEHAGKISEKNALLNELRGMYRAAKGEKLSGPGIAYVAEAEFKNVNPKREKYEKIKLRFPASDLLYLMKTKQKQLVKLSEAYDEVVEVGVPDWGVAALYEKSEAYTNFVTSYRSVQIPKNLKPEEKDDTEKSLKKIDDQMVKPLETKAKEILDACVKRAVQFHVANEYAAKCQAKQQNAGAVPHPAGLMPQPAYWSTRAIVDEVAQK